MPFAREVLPTPPEQGERVQESCFAPAAKMACLFHKENRYKKNFSDKYRLH